jgi:hypothetical protein
MTTPAFPRVPLVLRLSTGADVIALVLLTPGMSQFIQHHFDMKVLPDTTYLEYPQVLTIGVNTGSPVFTPYNQWDTATPPGIVPICVQQVLSVSVPTERLVVAFASKLGLPAPDPEWMSVSVF